MRLGKPIFNSEGQILVGYQYELTQNVINKLQKMGIEYLHIEDSNTEDIIIEDLIREETRVNLRNTLVHILDRVASTSYDPKTGNGQLYKLCSKSVDLVVSDLHHHDTISLMNMNVFQSNVFDQHFIQKAMNVCVYATKLGMIEGYTGEDLDTFSLAALLHDIGNLKVPREILTKKTTLTPFEYAEIKKHTEYGFKLLKEEPGIPITVAHCAMQHHERINGSGYPHGLKGDEIHPFAQWIGLIDTYDSLTHPRAHREAILPHQAIEVLYGGAGTLYDINKVRQFRNRVALFPLGLSVELSSGETGIVSKVNKDFKHRPVIRVLRNPYGEQLKQPYEIDLARHLNVMIFRVGEAVGNK
ncbi:HD-GYP domain-containing protein [Paenibacillus koleovorans]|uniref:HD-GYP domain-containing protein n=1 Tax=Paenibacillus koleovorans TaxID=121608 RepID=UPI0013E3ADE4|nr:HD domain-containing phosphohydrolase [Paenibacillus koleovorans]